jgi:hypothetical protein
MAMAFPEVASSQPLPQGAECTVIPQGEASVWRLRIGRMGNVAEIQQEQRRTEGQ